MEKRNNIILVIMSILVIIVSVLAIYFAFTLKQTEIEVEELSNKIESTSNNTSSQKNEVINEIKNDENQNNDTTSSNTNKVEEFKNSAIDLTKCLNSTPNAEFKIYGVSLGSMGSCYYDNTSAYIEFNDDFLKNYKSIINKKSNITNIDKKIVDVAFCGYGQDVTHTVLLFLLEDGTVNYLTYSDIVTNNNFASKKITDAKNIVRIIQGKVEFVDGPGRVAPFLVNNNGEFYDVSTMIK